MSRKETFEAKKERTAAIIGRLKRAYPNAVTALNFSSPLQLLISTILSAQCTDVRVNMVTPALFDRYRTAADFANADIAELEEMIRSTGFFHNKARNIQNCCRALVERHQGVVPNSMVELTALAGVGRKTANCVLGGAFGENSGVVVDTHVERLAGLLDISASKGAEKIEADLMQLIPRKHWYVFSNWIILHGRAVCIARRPKCNECMLRDLCPSAKSAPAGKSPARLIRSTKAPLSRQRK